jgi:hypothetical protein
MSFDTTLLAPLKSGLSKYYKPFLNSFDDIDNCYVKQGVIKKREGSTVIGRLPIWNTITDITNATPPVVTTTTNHGLQTKDMVYLENVLMTNGVISNVTIEAITKHAIVTVAGAPGVISGQTVLLSGVTGITELDGSSINNKVYFVDAVGANTITLNVQIMGTYIAGADFVFLGDLTNTAFSITLVSPNQFSLQTLNSNPPSNMTASGTATAGNIYLPIVGTRTFIQSNIQGVEQLVVFTPKQAFQFNVSTQVFDNISFNQTPIAITWEGTKDDFFYTSNYFGVMWTTNNISVPNNVVDGALQSVGIKYYTGNLNAGWTDFQPPLTSTAPTYLNSSLLILPHKGYLVTLNTTEGAINNTGNINFYNRARWSQLGTPFYRNVNLPTGAGFDSNAWVTDVPGKGGFTDADTSEKIVSAEIIQDTLIVGFQFSTWRLRFTGNYIQPFIWERIDTQFGSEATFSTIPFDDRVLMISRRGIVGATFNNVDRIDMDIPDQIEQFEQSTITSSYPTTRNNNALVRTHGIRDFEKRMAYWIYAEAESNLQTPNKILCFNYIDNTWSTFTQSFTTLGKFTTSVDDTWQTWTSPWNGDNSTWTSGIEQQGSLIIVAGDVKSQVWQIMNDAYSNDNGVNFDFSITTGWINPYFKDGKRCKLAYYDLYLTTTDNGEITLENFSDDNDSDPWLVKKVYTNDQALTTNPVKQVKYIRIFLGMTARNHQIKLTMTDNQVNNSLIGSSDFELQGILFHTRQEGRIKN